MLVQITIRDISLSQVLETHIRARAEKLTRFYERINSCRVVVEQQQKHKHQGKLYNVRINLTVPKKEFAVTHKYDQDVYVAVRDAFDAIERQLEEYARKRNGHVKTHQDVMHGHIARILSQEGYGFITGMDGNEYYFSITNVHHPDFNQLLIGDAVEYIPESVNDGLQAHHVVRERNNHRTAA